MYSGCLSMLVESWSGIGLSSLSMCRKLHVTKGKMNQCFRCFIICAECCYCCAPQRRTTLSRRTVKLNCCRRKGSKASQAQISIHGVTRVGTPSTTTAPQYMKCFILANEKGSEVRDMSSIIDINLVMDIIIFIIIVSF